MKVIEDGKRFSISEKLVELREIEKEKLLETNEKFYINNFEGSDDVIEVIYDSIWVTLKIGKNMMRVPNLGDVYDLADVVRWTAKILLWRRDYKLEDSEC